MDLNRLFGLQKQVKRVPQGNIHMIYLDITQLYQHYFLNSSDSKQRASALIALRERALDLAEICLHTDTEPEAEIYRQLSQ